MDEYRKQAYEVKCKTVMKALERNNMNPHFCSTKEEAADLVMSMIGENDVVSWGGSVTIDELGVKERLGEKGIKVIDRDAAPTLEENFRLRREGLLSDVYLTSTNAITYDGELLNIDGLGNRVAAMAYGPSKVIFVVGANKICPDLDYAYKRVKVDACPENAIRTNNNTPCRVTGKCANCLDGTICGVIQVIRHSGTPDRIHVIMVADDLGF
ncbi:MAG: lactate utilization protein [Anaerovoracaceae bacterium]|nr:lactate utilization protein [Anaerovoracaceae bacterium]